MEPAELALASEREGSPFRGMPARVLVVFPPPTLLELMEPQMDEPLVAPVPSKLEEASPDAIVSNIIGALDTGSDGPLSRLSPNTGNCGSSKLDMPVTDDAALGGTGEKCSDAMLGRRSIVPMR